MRIISLNTWGGRVSGIDDCIVRHASDTDIFCFQEMYGKHSPYAQVSLGVRPTFFEELENLLPDFVGYFSEQLPGTGLATFVRKDIAVERVESRELLSAEEVAHLVSPDRTPFYPYIMQVLHFKDPNLLLINFHGVPGSGKKDTPERDLQMSRLHKVIDAYTGEQIVLGDFNLNPDTEAIRGLETKFRNLIAEYGIQSTRTTLYPKYEIAPFADYAFVTPGISVRQFEVLQDVVSDHAPVVVEVSV